MNCPSCLRQGIEAPMIFYPGEYYEEDHYQEPDMYSCPDCGHDVLVPHDPQ